MTINIDQILTMEMLSLDHCEELYQLIDQNRDYLREWCPWVDITLSANDTENYIKEQLKMFESGSAAIYIVKQSGEICGSNGFHTIDTHNNWGEMGYWVSDTASGQGIATTTTRKLLDLGFNELGLHRIQIQCATDNHRSQTIPERLGFTYEATLRDSGKMTDGYVDHQVYSLLEPEYRELYG